MTDGRPDEFDELRREAERLRAEALVSPEDFGLHFEEAATIRARAEEAPASPTASLQRRFRWLGRGLSAACVATAVSVAFHVGSSTYVASEEPSVRPGAIEAEFTTAAQLFDAAGHAETRRLADAGTANYWRVASREQVGRETPTEREIWQGRQGPGVLIADGVLTSLPVAAFGVQSARLSWDELTALPTDVAGLRAFLDRETSAPHDQQTWYVFKLVGELLTETPAPPELRIALWTLATSIPGAEVDGRALDSEGRGGWSVGLEKAGLGRITYIIDVETGTILESSVAVGRAPARTRRTVYLEYGPTIAAPPVPAVPPAPAVPPTAQ